jgi:VanZ family protein
MTVRRWPQATVTAARLALAARVLLPVYLAAVCWIVFSQDDGMDQANGWAAWVFDLIDEMKAGLPEFFFVAVEFVANVVMFVPFGVLVWLAFARPRWWVVVLLGLATTVTIELVQSTMPSRYSTVSDVVANTLGAAAGVLLVRSVAARAVRRRG